MLEYSAAIVCAPLVPSEAGLCKSHGSHLLLDKKGVIISSNFRMTPASAQDDVEQNNQDDHILTPSVSSFKPNIYGDSALHHQHQNTKLGDGGPVPWYLGYLEFLVLLFNQTSYYFIFLSVALITTKILLLTEELQE